MYKEPSSIETTEKQEAHENHEAPRSVEKSDEEIGEQMEKAAASEVLQFKADSEKELAPLEAIIEKAKEKGFEIKIDNEDKNELQSLAGEAIVAEEELVAEITPPPLPNTPPPLPEEYLQKYSATPPPLPNIPPPFPAEYLNKFPPPIPQEYRTESSSLPSMPPPLPEEYLRNTPPYLPNTPPPLPAEYLRSTLPPLPNTPPPLPEISQAVQQEEKNKSAMKERVIINPELLNEKEASKKMLAEERIKLAQEIREQRNAQGGRLSRMKNVLESGQEKLEGEQGDKHFGRLSDLQSAEANLMVERISSEELSDQDAGAEKENMDQLIENSEKLKSIKDKIKEHYKKADEIAKRKFESMQKSIEQTMIRNNAFIVHTFLLDERLRHNENSNIAQRATLEDDIDILLSLEPSISTSSIVPGSRHGLWGGRIGVVLGGGDIRGITQTDNGTITGGIKMRNGKISSSKEIDEKVSDKGERGYNELVVNNPEVFGFFQNVQIDKLGNMIGFEETGFEQDNKNRKEYFLKYIDLAIQKGMSPLIMTPDRRLFEFSSISNEGIVSVGAEITPEQVAKGKAGLSNEKRKEIGEKIIAKNIFKKIDDQKEAKEIIAELSGKENSGVEVELSQEEYLAYARDNQGRFHDFPKHLLEDKNFMLEAAQFNPVSAYEYAGENLKKDMDFIKHVYSLEKKSVMSSIYSLMPDELKKNEGIALLAIENDDFENIDSILADSPVIWEKIVDKIVERKNPARWFSRNVGEQEIINTTFYMKKGFSGVDMTEKLTADTSFIQKLNSEYPNYKFEIDEYKQLLVTKLGE